MRPRTLALLTLSALLSACGGSTAPPSNVPPPSETGAGAPASAVEQFLGLAVQQKFTEMGYVFGNARGPIAERQEPVRVARRMQAIANVLRHDSYAMTGVIPVPGRPEARLVTVALRRGQRNVEVPFTVVQGPGGRWLVEIVDLEAAEGRQ